MGTLRRQHLRAGVFAVIVVGVLVGVRGLTIHPEAEAHLNQFEERALEDVGPDHPWFLAGINGDAQTYVLIALDPLARDVGRGIYQAPYRYSRFGFAILSGFLSLFQAQWILFGMALVGATAVGITAYSASLLSEDVGRRAWLLVVNPALYAGFMTNTAETLAIALLATTFWLLRSKGPPIALATVRPSYLVALLGRWRVFTLGLVTAAAVRVGLLLLFGGRSSAGLWTLTWPIAGYMDQPSIGAFAVAAAGLATLVRGVGIRDLGWIGSGLFVLCFSGFVLEDPINAIRAAGLLPVLWAFGPSWRQKEQTLVA